MGKPGEIFLRICKYGTLNSSIKVYVAFVTMMFCYDEQLLNWFTKEMYSDWVNYLSALLGY